MLNGRVEIKKDQITAGALVELEELYRKLSLDKEEKQVRPEDELEVIRMLCDDMSYTDIAKRFGLLTTNMPYIMGQIYAKYEDKVQYKSKKKRNEFVAWAKRELFGIAEAGCEHNKPVQQPVLETSPAPVQDKEFSPLVTTSVISSVFNTYKEKQNLEMDKILRKIGYNAFTGASYSELKDEASKLFDKLVIIDEIEEELKEALA